jgi:hypothetical protein
MSEPWLPSEEAVPSSAGPGSVSTYKWVLAIVLGVVVSVAASVAIAAVIQGRSTQGLAVIGGLIIGSLAAGSVVGARTARQWIKAGLLTFGGQLLLGIVLVVFFIR